MTTTSPRQQERDAADRVLADGLDIDLSEPPTREDLAMPDGRQSMVLENSDRSAFNVVVRFRDGHELATPASTSMVRANDSSVAPTEITLRRTGLTLEELDTVLQEAVQDLGADQDAVDAFREQIPRVTERSSGDLIRVIGTDVAAPDALEIQPIVTAAEGRVSVNYLISWESGS